MTDRYRCMVCDRRRFIGENDVRTLDGGTTKLPCPDCSAWLDTGRGIAAVAHLEPSRELLDTTVLYGDPVFVLSTIVHSVPNLEDASMEHGIGGPTEATLTFPGGHRHRITIERLSP